MEIPLTIAEAANGNVGVAMLPEFGREILQTTDFPIGDGWSRLAREAEMEFFAAGAFDRSRGFYELGTGDGRLGLLALQNGSVSFTGIELDGWRAQIARHNITEYFPQSQSSIIVDNAVSHLRGLEAEGIRVQANFMMCLPQCLNGDDASTTDVDNTRYFSDEDVLRMPMLGAVIDYGLELNAAVLQSLGRIATADSKVGIVLSDRIPKALHNSLFRLFGWQVDSSITRRERQDWDTSLDWMQKAQEAGRINIGPNHFFNAAGKGLALEDAVAEVNRVKRLVKGDIITKDEARHEINLFHGVTVYCLERK